jgi:AbrB family looped-hinge helix DNA binding protein
MITSIVRVSEKGQIAIPKEVREASNIKQGDDLILFSQDGKIFLEKSETLAAKAAQEVKWIKHLGLLNLKKVWEEDDARFAAQNRTKGRRKSAVSIHESIRREAENGARRLKR